MIDLKKLNVSLTKHGAHKLANLLKKYDADEILECLWGEDLGINIDRAQAQKNLSVAHGGTVPRVWNGARARGGDAIDGLVLISIIFSHHKLIQAMRIGRSAPFIGKIIRGQVLEGKAFTNFAHTLEELGYSSYHSAQEATFNLQKLFSIKGLNQLAHELLTLKLREAGWDGTGDLSAVMIALQLHESLAIDAHRFRSWLSSGVMPIGIKQLEDRDFFLDRGEKGSGYFEFRAGHKQRKLGDVPIRAGAELRIATLRHNRMQEILFRQMCKRYGSEHVGTEVATGHGTSIDLAVRSDEGYHFYEIKVASSLKACLRQAIPQLLEYAYWRNEQDLVVKLVIVGEFAPTVDAEAYLSVLRKRFALPIFYEYLVIA